MWQFLIICRLSPVFNTYGLCPSWVSIDSKRLVLLCFTFFNISDKIPLIMSKTAYPYLLFRASLFKKYYFKKHLHEFNRKYYLFQHWPNRCLCTLCSYALIMQNWEASFWMMMVIFPLDKKVIHIFLMFYWSKRLELCIY